MYFTGQKLDYDVAIIGAGISGLNFAYRLQQQHPDLTYRVFENRHEVGGTWSLFKYPGIRSDSDLFTFSFAWRPWTEKATIASAPLILNYINESIREAGIDRHVAFGHRVDGMRWSTPSKAWTLSITPKGQPPAAVRARFVFFGTGYYDYDTPLASQIPGIQDFEGDVIHPQFWPPGYDYADKNVVVVGSGATAVTLVPSMAGSVRSITMLQRSPGYMLSVPRFGRLEALFRAVLPTMLAYRISRLYFQAMTMLLFKFCSAFPQAARRLLLRLARDQLPAGMAMSPDFTPAYNPWDQRLCFCPDGDFYKSLHAGRASVKTDIIEQVTSDSIQLWSGDVLRPDVIVTATGLRLCILAGMEIFVDERRYDISEHYMWKAAMFDDLPNAALAIGYVATGSWTLGADAASQLACRLLAQMKKTGHAMVVPRRTAEHADLRELPVLGLESSYIKRAEGTLPKASDHPQWRPRTNYWRDMAIALWGDIQTDAEWL